jgi:hypothetical protein
VNLTASINLWFRAHMFVWWPVFHLL